MISRHDGRSGWWGDRRIPQTSSPATVVSRGVVPGVATEALCPRCGCISDGDRRSVCIACCVLDLEGATDAELWRGFASLAARGLSLAAWSEGRARTWRGARDLPCPVWWAHVLATFHGAQRIR